MPALAACDALQIILIQVKGGSVARLRAVAKRHCACNVLLATWKKERMPRFFRLCGATASEPWTEITNLDGNGCEWLGLFFQPFKKIEIVPIGVAKTYHSCTPTLIRRFAVEDQPFGFAFRIDAVNILYLKAYMVDS